MFGLLVYSSFSYKFGLKTMDSKLVIFIFSLLANRMPGDSTLRNLEVNLQKETFNWIWSFPTQFNLQTMAQSSKRIVVPFYLLLQKLVQWDHWKDVFCVSLFNVRLVCRVAAQPTWFPNSVAVVFSAIKKLLSKIRAHDCIHI